MRAAGPGRICAASGSLNSTFWMRSPRFSTFSAEIVILLQSGRPLWALAGIGAHLIGSLLMTFAGIATVVWLKA